MIASVPPSGRTRPESAEISVVLPAPLGPSRPKNSPWPISRSTPASACSERKRLVTPAMRIAGLMTGTGKRRWDSASERQDGIDVVEGRQAHQRCRRTDDGEPPAGAAGDPG